MISEFKGEYDFLSNYYECYVTIDGVTYGSSEHYYHAMKMTNEDDRYLVSNAVTPDASKQIAKKFKVREDWDKVKDSIMYKVVYEKFRQNKTLRDLLIDTGDEELQEGNWWGDTYWGVYKGSGQNKLGKILMQVREDFKKNEFIKGYNCCCS